MHTGSETGKDEELALRFFDGRASANCFSFAIRILKGWTELAKAPITSNLVIYFRVQLDSAPE